MRKRAFPPSGDGPSLHLAMEAVGLRPAGPRPRKKSELSDSTRCGSIRDEQVGVFVTGMPDTPCRLRLASPYLLRGRRLPCGSGPSLHLAMDLPSIWRWRLSDCGPPGLGLERNRSCQTRHDAGRSAMNRSGCSLQACRTPHAASVLPLRTCYGGGVFHAEAGDLMGQFGTRPSLR